LTLFMLDTNAISDLIRNPQGKVASRMAKAGENNMCTSIIVAAELRYGYAKTSSSRLLKLVEDLFGEINVLPFDAPADVGRLRRDPRRTRSRRHVDLRQ
jgi:tRNA(fMet)-specific endonuclease VapC